MHGLLSHSPDSTQLTGRSSIRSKCSCWLPCARSPSSMFKQVVPATLCSTPPRLPALGAQAAVVSIDRAVPAVHHPLLHTSLRLPYLSRCYTMAPGRAPAPLIHLDPTPTASAEVPDPTPPATWHTSSTCPSPASSPAAPDPEGSGVLPASSGAMPSTPSPEAPDTTAMVSSPAPSMDSQDQNTGSTSTARTASPSTSTSPPQDPHDDPGQHTGSTSTTHAASPSTSPSPPQDPHIDPGQNAGSTSTARAASPSTSTSPPQDPHDDPGQHTGSTSTTRAASPSTSTSLPQDSLCGVGQNTGSTSTARAASPSTSTSLPQAAHSASSSLPQAAPTCVVVVGVDPDTNGALAVASWLSYDLNEKVDLNRAQWQMYDVPVAVVELLTKTKDGKTRRRRWLDIIAARKIILQIVQRFNGDSSAYTRAVNQTSYIAHTSPWAPQNSLQAQQHQHCPPLSQQKSQQQQQQQQQQQNSLQEQEEEILSSSSSSSSSITGLTGQAEEGVPCSKQAANASAGGHAASVDPEMGQMGSTGSRATDAARANVRVDMRAFVEAPPIMPNSCSPRTMAQQLYAVGVWYGLLSMAGFQTATVNVMHWKGDLGLKGLDKNDSRLLARQLIPSKTSILERKKDHGRAEALLIAAWAMGCTRPNPTNSKKARKAASAASAAAAAKAAGVSASNSAPLIASSDNITPSLEDAGLLLPIPSYPAYAIDSNGAVISLSKGRKPLKIRNGSVKVKDDRGAWVKVRIDELISRSRRLSRLTSSVSSSSISSSSTDSGVLAGGCGSPSSSDPGFDRGIDQHPPTSLAEASRSGVLESSPGHLDSIVRHDSARGHDSHNSGQDTPDLQDSSSQSDCHQPSSAEVSSNSSSSLSSDSSSMATPSAVSNSDPVLGPDSSLLDGSSNSAAAASTSTNSPSSDSSSSRAHAQTKLSPEGDGSVSRADEDLTNHDLSLMTPSPEGGRRASAADEDMPSHLSLMTPPSDAAGRVSTAPAHGAGGSGSTAEEDLPSHLSLPVYQGPVRSLTSTDGYGNPLPYADFDADFTIPEVQAKVPKQKGSKSRRGGRPAAAASLGSSSSSSSARGGSRVQIGDSHMAEILGFLGSFKEEEDEGEQVGKEEGVQGPGIAHAPGSERQPQPKRRGRPKKGAQDGIDGIVGGQTTQSEGSGGLGSVAICGSSRQGDAGGSEEWVKKGRRRRGSWGIISGNEVSSIGGVSSRGASISGVASMGGSEASNGSGLPSSPSYAQEPVASSRAALATSPPQDAAGGACRSSLSVEDVSGTLLYPPPQFPQPNLSTVHQPISSGSVWSAFHQAPVDGEQGSGRQLEERTVNPLQAVARLEEQAVAFESSRNNFGAEGPSSTSIQHTFPSLHIHPGTVQVASPQLQASSTAALAVAHPDSDSASIMEGESGEVERRRRRRRA